MDPDAPLSPPADPDPDPARVAAAAPVAGSEPAASESDVDNLRRAVERLESRLADLNRFVDTLHAENEQLRRRELDQLHHPVLRDLMKLRDDWDAMAQAWRSREASTPADVASKCADVADDAQLILARYGVELLAPAGGDLFDRKLHRAVAQRLTKDPLAAGTVASVRRVGYVLGEKALRFADVVVYATSTTDDGPEDAPPDVPPDRPPDGNGAAPVPGGDA